MDPHFVTSKSLWETNVLVTVHSEKKMSHKYFERRYIWHRQSLIKISKSFEDRLKNFQNCNIQELYRGKYWSPPPATCGIKAENDRRDTGIIVSQANSSAAVAGQCRGKWSPFLFYLPNSARLSVCLCEINKECCRDFEKCWSRICTC